MDVEALAPALLAFGRLIRAANAELNKDRAAVRVLVDSEFEHKCFLINFDVIQTVLDQIKDFLDDETVKNAGEVLKKLGVLGGAVGTVLGFLKWRNGRKIESVQEVKNSPHALVLKVEGNDNTINIGADVLRMAQNAEVLAAVESTLTPIKDRKEARIIEFRQNDKPVATFEEQAVHAIIASCEDPGGVDPEEVFEEEAPKTVTAVLYSYGPVFDPKAPMWRFLYKRKPIYAEIKGTSIASDAVKRGGSFLNDRYKVKMEITQPHKEDGAPHYKVLEVLEFTPAEQQIALPLKRPKAKPRGARRGQGRAAG
jgi:hypothetical protein